MNNIANNSKLKAAIIGFAYAILSCGQVLADDTEIFFGSSSSSASTINPNVLFILDTSGSMSTEVGNTNKSRMDHMKEALNTLLDTIDNVNVGLMRFNNPGGPILYPTKGINEAVSTATASTPGNTIAARISLGSDDAEQKGATVDLTSTRLDIAYGASGSASISKQVSASYDDAEEEIDDNGDMSQTGNIINMDSSQINGIRFQATGIPQGANISTASLTFTSTNDDTQASTLRFYGELHNNPPEFGSGDYNISNRTKTGVYKDWNISQQWSTNQTFKLDGMANVIQAIVDNPTWAADDLVIIQTHESGSDRRAYTYNNSSSKAAVLDVSWSTGAAGNQTVGLRFQDVGIPQGATITSAAIEFTPSTDNAGTDGLSVSIRGEDSDDAPTYSGSFTARALTNPANTVSWSPGAWIQDSPVQTDSLIGMVQDIVDRPGWCGTNAMAFQLSSTEAFKRLAYSYEGDSSRAPVLRVTYDDSALTASQGCLNTTQVYRVDADNNDAEETVSSGNMSVNGNSFDMQNSQINGLRFTNLFINQGATILEATLEFTSKDNDPDSTTFTFKGEKVVNSGIFTGTNSDISNRATTTASVTWSPLDFDPNTTYTTGDLKTIIQEIVNQGGWAAGNALTLIQTGGANDRSAYTHNNSPGNAPLLRIKVQHGGAATAITKTVRTKLKELVNDFVPGGWTPIVDSLYEGAQYYRGGPVTYGASRGAQTTRGRLSHIDSYTVGTLNRDAACTETNLNSSSCANENISGSPVYTTPIVDACQSSYIVLLTDGQANNNHSTNEIESLIGTSCGSDSDGEACGEELALFLKENDQSTASAGGDLDGDQPVITHTVGFNLGTGSAVTFLQNIASNGGGTYNDASDADQLVGVFQNIIREILNVDTTFVSAGATVNQFNRLTHQNDIYFSLFKPNERPHWSGNIKKYKLTGTPSAVTDQNSLAAVDTSTGFFKSTSQSFWSAAADGNDVAQGGAADELSLTRNIYTYTGTSNNMTDASNALSESNTAITKDMLGIDSKTDAYRTSLLQWARGVDINDYDEDSNLTEVRKEMGAPLHSQPVIITYGGTSTSPDNTVFVSTNEGYLHAIDADDGTEHFSFVPQELLANLDKYYDNTAITSLPYGLDGSITSWVKDVDGDNQIESADSDHVYIYVGMRRGGRNYYAVNATDRTSPRVLWSITGGTGDFAELGQTWSKPILTKVKIGSTVKDVLIFAGGYDDDQDGYTTRTVDNQGRAIFIVDASTGALLWSGGPDVSHDEMFTEMTYSIPSDLSITDINGDDLADQIYVGDMGGQVWRFDIANGSAVADLVTGGVIADMASTTTASNRRFYFAPDIALLTDGDAKYYSINMGSGFRAHPLNEVITDRFYAIKDYDVYTKPADSNSDGYPDYTKLTESSLYDATTNDLGQGTTETDGSGTKDVALAALTGKSGWYITLENTGEKVLAESTTVNNQILFTTYQPNVATASACSAGLGLGRLYAVNAHDASPVLDLDDSGDDTNLTKSDRSKSLKHSGIPSTPTVLFPDGASPVVIVGPETPVPDLDFGNLTVRTYWYELLD